MITTTEADYRDAHHAQAIVWLLEQYACDPMGGGKSIAAERLQRLVPELARRPHALSVLAFDQDQAVGLINAFEGFSTFACEPLINVHDIVVDSDYRGRGVGKLLLEEIESIARRRGCCKLTLEVLAGNAPAQGLYRRFGFAPYQLSEELGAAMFWEKRLG